MESGKSNLRHSIINEVETFFKNNHFIYDDFDFDNEVQAFLKEMDKGLEGNGVLPMLPTYVEGNLQPNEGVKVITIDVGGTNLRICIAEVVGNNTLLTNTYKRKLPGINEVIYFSDFIELLVKEIEPFLEYSNMISLSFAHGVKHDSDLDGSVVELSKELHIEGIEGKLLGKSLKERLSELGYDDVEIILINDALGVASSMIQRKDEFSSFIGLVMGTGTNSCYIEKCVNIKKLTDSSKSDMFINVESGCYIPSIVSEFDIEYDKTTQKPNTAILEKMVSGRYLGELFYLIIMKACKASLFSAEFVKSFNGYVSITTEQMSKFYADKDDFNIFSDVDKSKQDIEVLTYICDKLIYRAANLIAVKIIALAAKAAKKGKGPILCVVEGTTYFGLKGFGEMVERTVKKNSGGIEIQIKSIEDAALKGIGNIGISMVKP